MALSVVDCAEVQVMPMTESQSHELNWRFVSEVYKRHSETKASGVLL